MDNAPFHKGISVVSVLSILWALFLLLSVAAPAPAPMPTATKVFPALILLFLSLDLFLTGLGLRQGKKSSARLNLFFWAGVVGMTALMKVLVSWLGIFLGLSAILLILVNGKDLN